MDRLELKTVFIGLLVGLAHIASGIAAFADPAVVNTTPLSALHTIGIWLGSERALFSASLLLGAGTMAVIGSVPKFLLPRYIIGLLFFPQEILLLLQIGSITKALIFGVYPDGYVPQGGAWFVLADQIWAWILAVSHSIWLAAFMYRSAAYGRDS